MFGLHENANIAKDEQGDEQNAEYLAVDRSASGATSSSSEDAEDDKVLSSEDTMYLVAETTLAKMKLFLTCLMLWIAIL